MPCNLEKRKRKKKNLLALSTNMWIGTEVTIEADGTVFIKWKRQIYTARTVAQEGKTIFQNYKNRQEVVTEVEASRNKKEYTKIASNFVTFRLISEEVTSGTP